MPSSVGRLYSVCYVGRSKVLTGSSKCLNIKRSSRGCYARQEPSFFGWQYARRLVVCSTQVLDTMRSKWTDSPEAYILGAAVTLNDFIYVVGDHDRIWTRMSKHRQKHRQAPAVVWRGCILVSGGGSTEPSSNNTILSPLTGKVNWT